MKRILVIIALAYVFFLAEIALYSNFGAWGKPELLTLLVVFFTLYLGIRFGIIAALMAGVLRDGIGVMPFGTYIIIYLTVAYVITYVRRFLYQPGSRFSRMVMAFFGVVIAFIVQALMAMMRQDYAVDEIIVDVLAPQLITTIIAVTLVFSQLKNLSVALRLK